MTIKSPMIEVTFDGENVKISIARDVCTRQLDGICREYRDTNIGDDKSPRQCMMHRHEIVDNSSMNEICFSRIPILECGSTCHSVGLREKRVSFTW